MIRGYRADDSYFSFATAFLNNTISLAQLEKAFDGINGEIMNGQNRRDIKPYFTFSPGIM